MSDPIRKDVSAARRDITNMRRTELNLPAELVVNRLERILDWADRQLADGAHTGASISKAIADEVNLNDDRVIAFLDEFGEHIEDNQAALTMAAYIEDRCNTFDAVGRQCYRGKNHDPRIGHAYTFLDPPALAAEQTWERVTLHGPRKKWADADEPPEGDGWELDPDRGRPGESWERFEYHEERYWRRRAAAAEESPAPAEETSPEAAPNHHFHHTVWCMVPTSGRCALFCRCECHLTQNDVALSR